MDIGGQALPAQRPSPGAPNRLLVCESWWWKDTPESARPTELTQWVLRRRLRASGNRKRLLKVHNVAERAGGEVTITREGAEGLFLNLVDADLT